MSSKETTRRTTQRLLAALLIVAGLSVWWAWGQAARLASPAPDPADPEPVLVTAWQPAGASGLTLFRSEGSAKGANAWRPLSLPDDGLPVAWAGDGGQRIAVALADGALIRSDDGGQSWIAVAQRLPLTSLAWDDRGNLYAGTEGRGIYRLAPGGTPLELAASQDELASARIVALAVAGDRLFAATPTAVFYAPLEDNAPQEDVWTKTTPVPDQVTALAAANEQTLFVGTALSGVFKSADAGQSWTAAQEGLGLAAGQWVRVTALRIDPVEPDVLYVSVDHLLGGTTVHASAAGVFVTLDGGQQWRPLAGAQFPQAAQAHDLVVAPGRPLRVQAVTAEGLQGYEPDVTRALTELESADPALRRAAARELGLGQVQGTWSALLARLEDPVPAVSLAAAEALGRINDPASVSGLLVALDHPSQQVRLGAARALGRMQVPAAVEPLRLLLMTGSDREVSAAAEALGRIGTPAALDGLLAALSDPQPTARWHAAMAALESLGEPAVGPLAAMLDSRDPAARRNAAEALGWIGSSSATRALVNALEDRDAAVRSQAAWALGEVGDPAARKALERAVARETDGAAQSQAAWALARLPQQTATASWTLTLAATLDRLQPLRWLILGLSLAGAAWLALAQPVLAPAAVARRSGAEGRQNPQGSNRRC